MKADLNTKFIQEISIIKEPEVFLGVARILKVKLVEDEFDENNRPIARDFVDIYIDMVENYTNTERRRKRELLKIIQKANKEVIKNANRAKNSEDKLCNEEM